ncbi:MAG TPA: hypothetical protein VK014_09200 [Cyclobacteriaceae bacterium]|nr:hypothetical protein [Cyclobacteriaceae bacterium]
MKRVLWVMLLFITWKVQAQGEATRSVFVEVGGASMVYSFNYDFRFDKEKLDSWGMRVGAGGYKLSDESLFTLPIQATRVMGKGKNYFEVGAGLTFINYTSTYTVYDYNSYNPSTGQYSSISERKEKDYHFILDIGKTPTVVGTLNIGYRRIPEDGGFTYRINLTPLFNTNGFWPLFAGVGLGYAF